MPTHKREVGSWALPRPPELAHGGLLSAEERKTCARFAGDRIKHFVEGLDRNAQPCGSSGESWAGVACCLAGLPSPLTPATSSAQTRWNSASQAASVSPRQAATLHYVRPVVR